VSGRRQPSLGGTSRMNREVHVRICERLGVQIPGSTRRKRQGKTLSGEGRGDERKQTVDELSKA
jgi:hypothetical protein